MIKVEIVSSKNSTLFCSMEGYKNENMIINKENIIGKSCFTVFYQKLSATIIYINKIIACEVKMKQTNLAATLQFQ